MFLDDVDYPVEEIITFELLIPCAHLHLMSLKHSTTIRCILRMFAYALASYRIAGGVAGSGTEEQVWTDQQEPQAQEVPEEEESGEELPECVDHHPSSFEKGKPRSILSLLFL
jgi:hypothetical protein